MFRALHQTAAELQALAGQQAEDAQYYRRILHGPIEIGADLAGMVHSQAKAQAAKPGSAPAPIAAPDLAVAFDRISRAVRRTITLARKVVEPVVATQHPAQHRAAARRRIIREVEDTIQRTAGHAEAESLHAELLDRLDAPDLEDDIELRPIADIIADICRDLGLAALPGTHPWKRRTVPDLAALAALASQARARMPCAPVPCAPVPCAPVPSDPAPCAPVPCAAAPSAAAAGPANASTGSDPPAPSAERGAAPLPGTTLSRRR
jgi:hypothetical protein